jgi:hypothetical protein
MSLGVGGAGKANRLWNAPEDTATSPLTTTADTTIILS